jgi:hypothetical protein
MIPDELAKSPDDIWARKNRAIPLIRAASIMCLGKVARNALFARLLVAFVFA